MCVKPGQRLVVQSSFQGFLYRFYYAYLHVHVGSATGQFLLQGSRLIQASESFIPGLIMQMKYFSVVAFSLLAAPLCFQENFYCSSLPGFPGPPTIFKDFSVLENASLKLKYCSEFPESVQTLLIIITFMYTNTTVDLLLNPESPLSQQNDAVCSFSKEYPHHRQCLFLLLLD